MNIEITESDEVIRDGVNLGYAPDVIANHIDAIETDNRQESLSYKVAVAFSDKARQRVSEACARADEAEGERDLAKAEADEACRYIPADEDEIEKEAQARANQIRRERAIDARAQEIADAE